eukprot:XP_011681478.1 PREDICTED: putative uncharacterized protein DDB_G0290521 [Strongylocentrotus purpuratus]
MTGGNSPMPSPRRTSSVLSTDPLIKASRANMALPPTPADLVRSPLSAPSLSVPISDGNHETETRTERQIDKEIDKRIATQSEKQIATPNEKPSTKPSDKPSTRPSEKPSTKTTVTRSSSNVAAQKPPVAPARPKKNNEQRSKPLFKFPPPPPIPLTPAPNKTSRADGTIPAANGGMMHNDKSKLLSKQKSLEDETSLMVCADDRNSMRSHFNDEHGNDYGTKDNLNKPVQSPYASI